MRLVATCALLLAVGCSEAPPFGGFGDCGAPGRGIGPAFMGLGVGDGAGDDTDWSRASDISADGCVVVGTFPSATMYTEHPHYTSYLLSETAVFRWTAKDGLVELTGFAEVPGYREAGAVSADGSVVVGGVGIFVAGGEAFRWTVESGMTGIGTLTEGFDSIALGVSDDGSVAVGVTTPGSEAFIWTESSGMASLGAFPGSNESTASALSGDGSVAVGVSLARSWSIEDGYRRLFADDEAFRWTAEEGMVGLGTLPGEHLDSRALGISADGHVIVGASESGSGVEAFRWTEAAGMVGLGDLAGGDVYAEAYDASADGSVIVGSGTTATGKEAFVWDPINGMRELDRVLSRRGLDLRGWTLSEASGVSDDGRTIVGTGTNPSGQTEAWIARIE